MPTTHHLTLPLEDKQVISAIQPGDSVFLTGILVTARDMAHHFFHEHLNSSHPLIQDLAPYLQKGAIYHCGPVINLPLKKVISAGPTTSAREEPYQKEVIGLFDLAAVIGKGGMGDKTLGGLKDHQAVYLHAVGGAGSYYASRLKVKDVFMLNEFGMPEALWVMEVNDFYTIATMTASGESLHKNLENQSGELLHQFL